MKKLISVIISSIIAVGAIAPAAMAEEAGADAQGVYAMAWDEMPVAYYGQPVIDGKKDDCYSEESKIFSGKNILTNCIDTDGSRGYAWFCWDSTGLYAFFEVDERTLSAQGKDQYHRDSVELFIDEDLSRSRVQDANDAQYRVTIESQHSNGMSAPTTFEGVAVVDEVAEKYYIELKAPWLEMIPTKDKVIGMDIQINDGRDVGGVITGITARRFCAGWATDKGDNWQFTEDYGNLRLDLGDFYPKWDRVSPLKVTVNAMPVSTDDAPPVLEDGRTLVPMRAIFEALGAGVAWNAAEQSAYAIGNGKLIIMPVGSNEVLINGQPAYTDVPVKIINGRTMVPVRFVSETLGAEVIFDDIQGVVEVKQ